MSKVKYIDTDEYVESPRIIFRHCKYIKSVIIDNDVLANCFNNCQGLESIIINLTRPLVINKQQRRTIINYWRLCFS